jgi:hypothetical protein
VSLRAESIPAALAFSLWQVTQNWLMIACCVETDAVAGTGDCCCGLAVFAETTNIANMAAKLRIKNLLFMNDSAFDNFPNCLAKPYPELPWNAWDKMMKILAK